MTEQLFEQTVDVEAIEAELDTLKNDQSEWVDQRASELDDALKQVETKYTPEDDGNTTMYEHLRGLLQELATDEQSVVDARIVELESKLESE